MGLADRPLQRPQIEEQIELAAPRRRHHLGPLARAEDRIDQHVEIALRGPFLDIDAHRSPGRRAISGTSFTRPSATGRIVAAISISTVPYTTGVMILRSNGSHSDSAV